MWHYYCAPMSDTPLPVYVDARKVFVSDASIKGTIDVDKLERVAASTADKQGQVVAEFNFAIDRAGRRRIRGNAHTLLMLTCQRCLEPVATELNEDIDLVLVEDEEKAQQLDKEFEPWVCEDHRIFLAALLDEQLLLGMPIVSVHESGPCSEQTGYQVTTEQEIGSQNQQKSAPNNPFAVLADFKVKRD
ncbi:MAG: DUF177 domain-containing protein, partial [Gammaproteobacteria bacterium]|nr:DUF177 domain-containing protein [Gammaproteobacteria bacterium]